MIIVFNSREIAAANSMLPNLLLALPKSSRIEQALYDLKEMVWRIEDAEAIPLEHEEARDVALNSMNNDFEFEESGLSMFLTWATDVRKIELVLDLHPDKVIAIMGAVEEEGHFIATIAASLYGVVKTLGIAWSRLQRRLSLI